MKKKMIFKNYISFKIFILLLINGNNIKYIFIDINIIIK
jgi:hypothetical protein